MSQFVNETNYVDLANARTKRRAIITTKLGSIVIHSHMIDYQERPTIAVRLEPNKDVVCTALTMSDMVQQLPTRDNEPFDTDTDMDKLREEFPLANLAHFIQDTNKGGRVGRYVTEYLENEIRALADYGGFGSDDKLPVGHDYTDDETKAIDDGIERGLYMVANLIAALRGV